MFETLKELSKKDRFSIDDKNVISMCGEEDFTVHETRLYTQDEGELLIIDVNDYYLIAHNFGGDSRYYFYEINESGTIEDLEELGFRLLDDDNEYKERFKIKATKPILCKIHYGPIYNLSQDGNDGEINFCEYRTSNKQFPVLAMEENEDIITLYQGIRISESNIVI